MNKVKIFNSEEFGDVRTVTINGDPWFVGKDVAAALGFTNPRDAISTHVFDEDKGVESIDTLGGKQKMTVINESGLYAYNIHVSSSAMSDLFGRKSLPFSNFYPAKLRIFPGSPPGKPVFYINRLSMILSGL